MTQEKLTFQHNKSSKDISIYVHWPFCKSKCPYCDFNSHASSQIDAKRWNKAFLKQIDFFEETLRNKNIKSIFFGGGTPSLMPPDITYNIIDKLSKVSSIDHKVEITLEANPTSVEAEKFKAFKEAGVNRLSIGIQSFNKEYLHFLGRTYSPKEGIEAIKTAQQHFDNYSFDLIYSLPQQSLSNLESDLEIAIELATNHISLYELTIEKGTEFYRKFLNKELIPLDEKTSNIFYDFVATTLSRNGYQGYEISNYAKPGFESVHNLRYWHYQDYLGIGPGAHSRISFQDSNNNSQMQAFDMHYRPDIWLDSTLNKENAIKTLERLTSRQIIDEILIMGLRLSNGIGNDNFLKFFGKNFQEVLDMSKLKTLQDNSMIELKNDNIKLLPQGYRLLNKIIEYLKYNM